MESYREIDMHAEQILGQFLDKNLYKRLVDKYNYKYTRYDDKKTQMEGVDVLLQYKQTKLLIDEKASFYYANTNLKTFALEIDFIPKGSNQPIEGWFVNDGLKTTDYLLMWLSLRYKEIIDPKTGIEGRQKLSVDEIDSPTDFTSVEAMLINRDKLKKYVSDFGFSKKQLLDEAKRIRNNWEDSDKWINEIGNVRFYYSEQLKEKPINVLIPKKELASLARAKFLISNKGYERIP